MPARDLIDLDATAQLAALQAGRIGAVELLKAALARHEATHARINAVINADLERALERARAIDDARAKGETLGPLAGLPMTVKDTFDAVGMPASSGLEAFRRRTAEDAIAVAHVRRAGAVIWGKTNTPVMAGDFQTYNKLYGTTNNPWDPSRTPGGSSGGAAAALALGVTALEIGSDIGGSLRTPASFSGVFAHKPTWGLVSTIGHVPPHPGSFAEPDLGVAGPMARSARDLRLLLSVLENGPLSARAPPVALKGLRVGLWITEPRFVLDPEVKAVVEAFGGKLAAAGADIAPIPTPVDAKALMDAYMLLLMSVLGATLPPRQRLALELTRPIARLAARADEPPGWAVQALASTARHHEWLAADAVRARLSHEMRGAFERHDVIIAPIDPVAAFAHDHTPFGKRSLRLSTGASAPYTAMLQWISLATACGLPATAVPAGLSASGLPVGVQIIGPRGGDARTLAVAQAIDENIGGFVPPPTE
jgi:amidase